MSTCHVILKKCPNRLISPLAKKDFFEGGSCPQKRPGTEVFNLRRRARKGGKPAPQNRLRPLSELAKAANLEICNFLKKAIFKAFAQKRQKCHFWGVGSGPPQPPPELKIYPLAKGPESSLTVHLERRRATLEAGADPSKPPIFGFLDNWVQSDLEPKKSSLAP